MNHFLVRKNQTKIIRPATEDDLPKLFSLLAMPEIRQGYFGATVSDDFIRNKLDESLLQAKLGKGEILIISCKYEGPIAYAELVQGWLAFCVHPQYSGLQYATSLVKVLCRRAVKHGPLAKGSDIHTSVLRGNLASIIILEKFGFVFKGLKWQDIAPPLPAPMLLYSGKI